MSTRSRAAGALTVAGAATALAATVVQAGRRRLQGRRVGAGGPTVPLAVTVHVPVEQAQEHPALAGLRDDAALDLDVRPAPGQKGAELRLRPAEGRTWDDLDPAATRLRLREAKSLVEAGQFVQPTDPGNSRPTLLNTVLRDTAAHSREGGRL